MQPELARRGTSPRATYRKNATVGKLVTERFTGRINWECPQEKDVFIIHPPCAPSNDNLMELISWQKRLRRASATRVTACYSIFLVMPDKSSRTAQPDAYLFTAKVVADMISAVGINRVLTVDLHADQIPRIFRYFPVDKRLRQRPLLLEDFTTPRLWKNITVVSQM